jgi:2,2-dialkylglycine decarboxylase (pyruvate)
MNIVQMSMVSSVLRFAPPLTMTDGELDLGLSILDEALTKARR